MSKVSFIAVLILLISYSLANGQSAHYFDKYIEGVFKTIESPPAECLKLLEESDESKMLANKDLLMCYTLIENEIPKQLRFDILSYRPKEIKRAGEIKNTVIFGTCYRKDSSSKYYAHLYADLEPKPNKSLEENIYIANINTHCNNIYSAHLETENILIDIRDRKRNKTIGDIRKTFRVLAVMYLLISTMIYLKEVRSGRLGR